MGKQRTSYPRLQRTEAAPAIDLTEDDLAVLKHVARHRFIRSDDLYRLMSHRSADKLSRRLVRLFRAGYLDRPPAQIDYRRGQGSQPLVYGLGAAGAAHLAEEGLKARGDDLARRNRCYTRENLDHTLATSHFMVDMELACHGRPDVTFLSREIVGDQPLRWRISLPWQGNRADVLIAPDAMFGLKLDRPGQKPLRSFYFVEIDRGSMTIAPSEQMRRNPAFLYRSSLLRKFLAYAVSHEDGVHQQQFGIRAARVLFLTNNPKRCDEMRRAAETLVIPHLDTPMGLFLFGCLSEKSTAFDLDVKDTLGRSVSFLTTAQ